jgi:hypothetical protein
MPDMESTVFGPWKTTDILPTGETLGSNALIPIDSASTNSWVFSKIALFDIERQGKNVVFHFLIKSSQIAFPISGSAFKSGRIVNTKVLPSATRKEKFPARCCPFLNDADPDFFLFIQNQIGISIQHFYFL